MKNVCTSETINMVKLLNSDKFVQLSILRNFQVLDDLVKETPRKALRFRHFEEKINPFFHYIFSPYIFKLPHYEMNGSISEG